MYILTILRQLLFSIPLAALWMLIYLFLILGWGLPTADKFIVHWNKFVDDGPFMLGTRDTADTTYYGGVSAEEWYKKWSELERFIANLYDTGVLKAVIKK